MGLYPFLGFQIFNKVESNVEFQRRWGILERGSLSLPHEKIIVKERRRKENEGTNDREKVSKMRGITGSGRIECIGSHLDRKLCDAWVCLMRFVQFPRVVGEKLICNWVLGVAELLN
ncbi:hypothetical protein AAC387_Pa09g2208 [Persea americana]